MSGGQIEFRNCTFAYPSRPDAVVLRNFSLVIEPGQTVAIVGQSGSGKSTVVGLLERFYDLLEGQVLSVCAAGSRAARARRAERLVGQVLVDDVPVTDWNLAALRDQIGLVQQVLHRSSDGGICLMR